MFACMFKFNVYFIWKSAINGPGKVGREKEDYCEVDKISYLMFNSQMLSEIIM